MLIQREHFEPLSDAPWVPARVEDAIAAIVADTEAAFDSVALWPADEWDAYVYREGHPLKVLYAGAAGVAWALDALRRSGHAETPLDLAGAVMHALELERAEPDAAEDEHYRPGALLDGEAGMLLAAFRLGADAAVADDLHALVHGNVDNPTDDISWGAPGTLLVALAMHEWTGEPRWLEAARESAAALRARRGEDGLWRQDDDYRGLGTLHGAAGNTLALRRLEPDDVLASETAAVLARHAVREDGLANWPGATGRSLVRPRDGRIALQWCTGAPGVLAGAWAYLDEDLVLAGAELVWRAGAHRDEKGPQPLPRHFQQRVRAAQGIRSHRRRTLARARPALRGPRARPGRTDGRRERPPPLFALHGRPRDSTLRSGLSRRRPALPDRRSHVGESRLYPRRLTRRSYQSDTRSR